MSRDEEVLPGFQAMLFMLSGIPGLRFESAKGIDHHIAGKHDPFRIMAFLEQMFGAGWFRDVQPVRDRISDDPVDLFRHAPVERTQSGLYMDQRNVQLAGSQCHGHGRVHVAHNQDPIRVGLLQDRLDTGHDFGRLNGMRS